MAVNVEEVPAGVTAKDIVLALIAKVGTGGGQGYIVEYRGSAIRALSWRGRMTICNMSIEWGAKADLIAPDETVHLSPGPPARAPRHGMGRGGGLLVNSPDRPRRGVRRRGRSRCESEPVRHLGHQPGQGVPLGAAVPDPETFAEGPTARRPQALEYMALEPGRRMRDIAVDAVFLGSCTNGRIEDLRAAAAVIEESPRGGLGPDARGSGSARVRLQAESEGLDVIFKEAGAEWRAAGCSMCLGMNPDQLAPGERSASTSNRNFEAGKGKGGRTHLVSPLVAAATAVTGRLNSPADLKEEVLIGG